MWIVSVVNSYDSSVSVSYGYSFILENKSCSGSRFQNVKLNSEQLLLVEQLVSRTAILVIILPPPPPTTGNTILQTLSGHPIVATTAALLLPPNPTTQHPNSSSSKATETEWHSHTSICHESSCSFYSPIPIICAAAIWSHSIQQNELHATWYDNNIQN